MQPTPYADNYLTERQEPENTLESDIASDTLDALERQKSDLCDVFTHLQCWGEGYSLSMESILNAEGLIEEAINDLLHKAWKENYAICRTLGRDKIPNFIALRHKQTRREQERNVFRKHINRRPVPTNPATRYVGDFDDYVQEGQEKQARTEYNMFCLKQSLGAGIISFEEWCSNREERE